MLLFEATGEGRSSCETNVNNLCYLDVTLQSPRAAVHDTVGSGSRKSGESSAVVSQAEKSESRIEISWKTAGVCVRDTAPFTMIRPVNSRCDCTTFHQTNNAVYRSDALVVYPIGNQRRSLDCVRSSSGRSLPGRTGVRARQIRNSYPPFPLSDGRLMGRLLDLVNRQQR